MQPATPTSSTGSTARPNAAMHASAPWMSSTARTSRATVTPAKTGMPGTPEHTRCSAGRARHAAGRNPGSHASSGWNAEPPAAVDIFRRTGIAPRETTAHCRAAQHPPTAGWPPGGKRTAPGVGCLPLAPPGPRRRQRVLTRLHGRARHNVSSGARSHEAGPSLRTRSSSRTARVSAALSTVRMTWTLQTESPFSRRWFRKS